MTKEEFLKKVNLSDSDFRDLIHKFYKFEHSLNARQKAAVRRCMPTHQEALRALGSNVTAEDLQDILREIGVAEKSLDDGQLGGRSVLVSQSNGQSSKH